MSIIAYPAKEAGGLVWVYMGAKDKMPAFPEFEWTHLPPNQVHTSRWIQRSNFMQGVEGEIDTSHVSFLHQHFDEDSSPLKGTGSDLVAFDGAPEITIKETSYGFTYGARRQLEGKQFWRVTQWMAPMFSQIPRTPNTFDGVGGRAWVPIDDDNVTTFGYNFRVDRPFTHEELDWLNSGQVFPPRTQRGTIQLQQGQRIDTFLPVANIDNDYLIDRAAQKDINFSGIWGVNEQDRALQESMAGGGTSPKAVDRSREHLVASDLAIVTARRVLLKMARDLQNGIEPLPAQDGKLYAVRAISRICDVADFDTFVAQFGDQMKAPNSGNAGRADQPLR
jgi:phenylpropionate dioxygenase-like ring-hydroxylating dioxygenase large terminal subunit